MYGVELGDLITPEKVLKVIIECFFQAHCLDSQLVDSTPEVNHSYCEQLVKQKFQEVGGNYDVPSKESLLKLVESLAKYSEGFRDKTVIEQHLREISALIDQL